jgi:hypothetical protein
LWPAVRCNDGTEYCKRLIETGQRIRNYTYQYKLDTPLEVSVVREDGTVDKYVRDGNNWQIPHDITIEVDPVTIYDSLGNTKGYECRFQSHTGLFYSYYKNPRTGVEVFGKNFGLGELDNLFNSSLIQFIPAP